MKALLLSVFVAVISLTAVAAPKSKTVTGKCAKQAAELVQANWANVPNPDENLEIDIVSSNVDASDKSLYTVKWGDFDGNQGLIYLSKVKVTPDCQLDGKIESQVIGSFDGQ